MIRFIYPNITIISISVEINNIIDFGNAPEKMPTIDCNNLVNILLVIKNCLDIRNFEPTGWKKRPCNSSPMTLFMICLLKHHRGFLRADPSCQ
jgi:hypothetical protein